MFVPDVSDFQFVGKVKPVFFIANEEVLYSSSTFALHAKAIFTMHVIQSTTDIQNMRKI